MRVITTNELPEILYDDTLIKSGKYRSYKIMAKALERTITSCSEIRADYEQQSKELRENYQKSGFESGFKLFFSQIVALLNEYEDRQNARFNKMRENLALALRTSLHDPIIVERIIHHLQEQCGHQKALSIIIPRQVNLPADADISNYQYSDDNHITVQNDMDAIRFPGDSLCQQWLQQSELDSAGNVIDMLIPDFLHQTGNWLIELSEGKCSLNPSAESD